MNNAKCVAKYENGNYQCACAAGFIGEHCEIGTLAEFVLINYMRTELIEYEHSNIYQLILHQLFSLARDWFKRVTWANIPQLKLGNIRGYSSIFKTARVA